MLRIDGSNGPEELEFLSENDTGPTALFSDPPSNSSVLDVDMKQAGCSLGDAPATIVDKNDGSNTGATSLASSSQVCTVDVKLEQLQALGFNRAEAEAALTQADGEVNLAASILFSSK